MKVNNTFLILTALLLITGMGSSNATIITFNGQAPDGGFTPLAVGSNYNEGGYTMTATAETVFFVDDDFNYQVGVFDDDLVDLNNVGAEVSFASDDGGTFNAIRLNVAQINQFGSLTFTGNIDGGGTVIQTSTACGLGCLHTIDLIGFTDLVSFEILSTANYMSFDNLELVSSAPEPSTLILMAIGLAGIGYTGRKRKQV
jgi:hypothetical protein